MIKLSTFLLLLLAVTVFTATASSIHRENGWNYRHGPGSSGSSNNREAAGHQTGWDSRHGTGAAGFNPGTSNTNNNGQGYNEGSTVGSGYNSGSG